MAKVRKLAELLNSRRRGEKYRISATITKDNFIKLMHKAEAEHRSEANIIEFIINDYFKITNYPLPNSDIEEYLLDGDELPPYGTKKRRLKKT